MERKFWSRLKAKNIQHKALHITRVEALAVGNGRLYTGAWDATIKVWDTSESDTPAFVTTFYGHDSWVNTLVLHGDRLYSGSKDKTIRVWDLTVTKEKAYLACKATLAGHTGAISALAVSENGTRLFSSSWDQKIRMWDVSGMISK